MHAGRQEEVCECSYCTGILCPECDAEKDEICDDCNVNHDIPPHIVLAKESWEADMETRESAMR